MDLSRPVPVGEPSVKGPEKDDDDDAQRETQQHLAVLAVMSKNLLWADRTPKDGGGEEGVDARASQFISCIWGANPINVQHLKVQDTDTDNGTNQGGNHLRKKGLTGRNFDVVGELEVVGKPNGMCASDIAKRLEIVHG